MLFRLAWVRTSMNWCGFKFHSAAVSQAAMLQREMSPLGHVDLT